jgi:hypothetical protein
MEFKTNGTIVSEIKFLDEWRQVDNISTDNLNELIEHAKFFEDHISANREIVNNDDVMKKIWTTGEIREFFEDSTEKQKALIRVLISKNGAPILMKDLIKELGLKTSPEWREW